MGDHPVFIALSAEFWSASAVRAGRNVRQICWGTILIDNLYLAIAFADNLQNHLQTVCFAVAAKGNGCPAETGTTCSANSVDIGLANIWQIEIYHMTDGWNIYAACRHICCDQRGNLARFEFVQHFTAQKLFHIAMQRIYFESLLAHICRKLVCTPLGTHKNHTRAYLITAQQFCQLLTLPVFRYQPDLLENMFGTLF